MPDPEAPELPSTEGEGAPDDAADVSLEGPPPRLAIGLIPTLDGAPLRSVTSAEGAASFTTEDGAPVAKDREDDIVFLNPAATAVDEGGWWSAAGLGATHGLLFSDERFSAQPHTVEVEGETFSEGDVAAMLAAAAGSFAPAGASEPSPSTFHRRLGAFLDATDHGDDDDDDAMGAASSDASADDTPFDYGFWKATLTPVTREDTPEGAASFEATVFWGEADEPSVYRYWVLNDPAGTLAGAGWHERPPPMQNGDAPFTAMTLDDDELTDLFPLAVDDSDDEHSDASSGR